jgi:hypothetical protein
LPVHKKVSIPFVDKIDSPRLPLRYSYYHVGRLYRKKSRDNFTLWGRHNGMGMSVLGSVCHASSKVIGEKYFDTHPEYYALVKGKRTNLWKYGKICHSNMDVVKVFADYAENSDYDFISASANDGKNWCECEECKKLDGHNAVDKNGYSITSGRMFTFANRIARELKRRGSKKKVAIYAYSNYKTVPTNVDKLEDNVLVFLTHGINWTWAPSSNKEFVERINQWSKFAPSVVLRDYKDNIRPMQLAPFPHLAAKRIKYLVNTIDNFQGINTCGDDARDFGLIGPTAYVYSRLLWDPNRKLEDILDDYYLNGWPNAHKYVRSYFEYFEKHMEEFCRKTDDRMYTYYGDKSLLNFPKAFPVELLAKGKEFLDEAYNASKGEVEKKRVEFLLIGFQAVKNDVEYFTALIELAKSGEPLVRIPVEKVELLSDDKKLSLIKRAYDATVARQSFLEKHAKCEAIPSEPFNTNKEVMTGIWDSLINRLYELKVENAATVTCVESGWTFKIDPDEKGRTEKWFSPEFDDSAWGKISTATFWERQGFGDDKYGRKGEGGYNGWGWYRRTIKFPEKKNANDLIFTLGAVDESFDFYVNGTLIKSFRYDAKKNPNSWKEPQYISIGKYIKWGEENQITIAVHDKAGVGGIWQGSSYKIVQAPVLLPELTAWYKRTLSVSKLDGSNGGIVEVPQNWKEDPILSVRLPKLKAGDVCEFSVELKPIELGKVPFVKRNRKAELLNSRFIFFDKD